MSSDAMQALGSDTQTFPMAGAKVSARFEKGTDTTTTLTACQAVRQDLACFERPYREDHVWSATPLSLGGTTAAK